MQIFLTPPWITWQPLFRLSPQRQNTRAWSDLFGCRHGPVMRWCRCFLAVVCRSTVAWTRHTGIYMLPFIHMGIHMKPQTNLLYLLPTFALILIKQIHNDNTLSCSQIQWTKQTTLKGHIRVTGSQYANIMLLLLQPFGQKMSANLIHLWHRRWQSFEKRLCVCPNNLIIWHQSRNWGCLTISILWHPYMSFGSGEIDLSHLPISAFLRWL